MAKSEFTQDSLGDRASISKGIFHKVMCGPKEKQHRAGRDLPTLSDSQECWSTRRIVGLFIIYLGEQCNVQFMEISPARDKLERLGQPEFMW